MKILFAASAAELFDELPQSVKRKSASCIELLVRQPRLYPIRRRGLMHGYRYFVAGRYLFYYSLNSEEVRITAIIPAAMRLA